ncbi:MAG: transcriptional regulator with XRE-family HTH domain [Arenicella sp.]|jgi:transcriptional regulator with XRE-family HTH domain
MPANFKTLVDTMSSASQAEISQQALTMLAEMPLAELRQARKFSQVQIAELMEIQQPAEAKMEQRTDMYISSMRRLIEAMGGQLEIRGHFADGDVVINQFEDLDRDTLEQSI